MIRCKGLALLCCFTVTGCAHEERIQTRVLTNTCIKPLVDYHYQTCNAIKFKINKTTFVIPANFETDLASIPKIAWPIMAPHHATLVRPAIIHDWFYRKTCDFDRKQTDLIFYHMLKNDGVSTFTASLMYYAVRAWGWNYYNEDYCD